MAKLFFCLLLITLTVSGNSQDLIVSDITGPTEVNRYGEFSYTVTVTNNGIVDITRGNSTTLYLSSDTVLSGSDTYLSSLYHPQVKAGESKSIAWTLDRTLSVSAGNYYLIARADANNQVTETDEENNVRRLPVVVNPSDIDLTIQTLSLPGTIACNDQLPLTYKITNNGSYSLHGSCYVSFYLSSDAVLDETDEKLDYFYLTFDGTDTVTNETWHALIVPQRTPGQYHLIGNIDDNYAGQSEIDESNESNNSFSIPLTLTASNVDFDLTETPATVTQLSPNSADLMVHFEIGNTGTTGAWGYEIAYYLSDDTQWDESDYLLWASELTHTSYYLPAGATEFMSEFIQPIDPTNSQLWGTHYVIIRINPEGSIPEADMSDNVIATSNQVTLVEPYENVTITSAEFYGSYYDIDTALDLHVTLLNSGTATSTLSYYEVIILDSLGTQLWSDYYYEGFLYPGESETVTWTLELTERLKADVYFVNIEKEGILVYETILEIEESILTLSGVIQGEDGTPITKGKLFLYEKQEDGTVLFTQKIVPTVTDEFGFAVGAREYTLYFIPDNSLFPEHVPTVYGKTLLLVDTLSYLTLRQDTHVVFEILKVQSIGSGIKSISGSISQSGTGPGRLEQTHSISGIPVVLLSDSGVPVAVTETDENGHFEFTGLPDGAYQVLVSFEPDQVVMTEPIPVDVTVRNAEVSITLSATGVTTEVAAVLLSQTIAFEELSEVTYGEAPFQLAATSSSGLPITYSSSNPSVATVEGNTVTIHDPGTTLITASQQGNDVYLPAESVSRTLVVTAVTSLEDPLAQLRIYPNPSRGFVYIESQVAADQVTLTDVAGRQHLLSVVTNVIDIRAVDKGFYLLHVKTRLGTKAFRIVRE